MVAAALALSPLPGEAAKRKVTTSPTPKAVAKPKTVYSTKALTDFMAQCQTISDDERFPKAVATPADDKFPNENDSDVARYDVAPKPGEKGYIRASAVLSARLVPAGENNYALSIKDGSRNADVKVPLASIMKDITAYRVFEKIRKGDMKRDDMIDIPLSAYCLPDNKFAVEALQGVTKISVEEALTLMLRQSNNTATKALAMAADGSEEAFIKNVNAMVKGWGLKNTEVANSHGMPQGDRSREYTTANDMAVIVQHMLAYKDDYVRYAAADLTVNGRKINERHDPIRDFLRKINGGFKSGTSVACRSFIAWFPLKDEFHLSISMCAGSENDRYAALRSDFKETGLLQEFTTRMKNLVPQAPSAKRRPSQPVLMSHLAPSSE